MDCEDIEDHKFEGVSMALCVEGKVDEEQKEVDPVWDVSDLSESSEETAEQKLHRILEKKMKRLLDE